MPRLHRRRVRGRRSQRTPRGSPFHILRPRPPGYQSGPASVILFSGVEQVLRTAGQEGGQFLVLPVLDHAGIVAGENHLDGCRVADEFTVDLEVEFGWEELVEGGGDFKAETSGAELFAVGNYETDAGDSLPFEVGSIGCEAGGIEADAGNPAPVEVRGEFRTVDECRPDLFERGVGTAANGVVGGVFEHADAGKEESGIEGTHVGGWVYPDEAGGIEPIATLPAAHLDDFEWDFQL